MDGRFSSLTCRPFFDSPPYVLHRLTRFSSLTCRPFFDSPPYVLHRLTRFSSLTCRPFFDSPPYVLHRLTGNVLQKEATSYFKARLHQTIQHRPGVNANSGVVARRIFPGKEDNVISVLSSVIFRGRGGGYRGCGSEPQENNERRPQENNESQ